MKTIFYNKEAQFNLTDEEFDLFIKNPGKKVLIPRLNVFLSDMFIWAGDKPKEIDTTKRTLYDGTRVINKFGAWYLENNQDVKVDLNYYSELKEIAEVYDPNKVLPISGFSKELSDKI